MKDIKTYQNKKVLVLGLGRSGIAVSKLLVKLGAIVIINDSQEAPINSDIQELENSGVKIITGSHPLDLFDQGFEYMFKNPGIPYSNVMAQEAEKRNIPILTEPELAYEVLEGQMVAVTGTNGKTTTTTLISQMLASQTKEHKVFTGGNIGLALSNVAQVAEKNDYLVAELSSFQLMGVKELHPKIAVLTNIYSAHLDYHGSRENYIDAKMNITKNQTAQDYFVVNYDDEEWIDLVKQSQAQIIPFTKGDKFQEGAYIQDDAIYFQGEKIIPVDEIRIPGSHNVENAMAAICAAKLLNISNEHIQNVLTTFTGVKHRIQFVETVNQRKFYNDSKATNIEATTVALTAFKQPINLIAGGLDRGNGFDELIPNLKNVKTLVAFGQTADKLVETAQAAKVSTIVKVADLKEATQKAFELSEPEEIILLSPACASWDQYDSFEQRGDEFIAEVEKIRKETDQ
ncbi:UDP-N-acetylmuramoyl-L-alanine--D-glutamate ligase [Lactobacillus sp. YT155]|uniref:UDP-N-acetylmuramoyl-L-alanine--D-glutamate ligase n=1 Tax=Lactobacillus sp. YT155 TaxID=3060955 RepID=UPI00265F8EA3|nr:UDP-N-acetylmuramoyl-L-alanine--D-glutamate ligase [Lactobacillus sp. YT155]MDO1605267.1 UDP-N-acetylmuramoyl-L-alanine--D-glutamate ligase [Lactobacillus sp. YT155]